MATHSHPTASLADVKQLTYFRIYKTHPSEQHGTIKLFSNGNQQCPIKVGLVAADANENPITLTQAEVERALKLIHYDGGAALGSGGDSYTYSFIKNRFTWTEAAIPVRNRHENESARDSKAETSRAHRDPSPADIQIYTLYVSASAGSSGLAVAARFDVTDALFFTTDSAVDDADGQGQDGQFNSSVEVLLADPPYLSATDFGAASNGVVAGRKVGDSSTYFYWATEYYLDPKLNGRAVPLLSVGASASTTDAFGFYTHSGFFDNVKWGISYYSQPGNTDANGLPMAPLHSVVVGPAHGSPLATYLPPSMYANCVDSIQGANANRIVIGILKGNLDGQFRDSSGGSVSDVANTTMHILDAYGNDHAVSLSYDAVADEFMIL
jgi:hypothetical protein